MKVPCFLTLLVCCAACASAQDVSIPAPQKRMAIIESTSRIVGAEPQVFPAGTKNPFAMKGFEQAVAPVSSAKDPAAEQPDLLSILGDLIDAKGRAVMNGEPMLLIGGKKLRVGSKVSVTHGGLVYELEIAAIDTTKFTVRYKTEEYTRPITLKTPPSKKP